ncbi:MAG: metalloregulator ArsR/SmtB family transcription factor [Saprospiraceae bacterium]
MEPTALNISEQEITQSAEILRALAHPLRIKILGYIDENPGTNVKHIYDQLNLEQSITSQHLRILRSTGLVLPERNGKFINYCLNYAQLGKSIQLVKDFLATEE